MTGQDTLKKFDKLYKETYKDVSTYIVINCSNLEDARDIIQSTYMEVFKKIDKIDNKNYIIGIARNKLNKFYRFNYKAKIISLFSEKDDLSLIDTIPDDFDLEKVVITKYDIDRVWKFIKKKRNIVSKVIYLYYYQEYTIKEISKVLNISESNVKHYLYRTIKELNTYLESEVN